MINVQSILHSVFTAIKMLMRIAVILFIFVICIGLFSALYKAVKYPTPPLASEFNARLREAEQLKSGPVFLSDLTPFSWEKACFVTAYESSQEVQARIGNEYILEPIDNMDDGRYYLVFALPDKHTVPVRISRALFKLNEMEHCITFAKAKITPLKLHQNN